MTSASVSRLSSVDLPASLMTQQHLLVPLPRMYARLNDINLVVRLDGSCAGQYMVRLKAAGCMKIESKDRIVIGGPGLRGC